MFSLQTTFVSFLFGINIATFGQAYFLDESCKEASIRHIVEEGLANAFLDARIATEELSTRPWSRPDKSEYMDLALYTLKDDGHTQRVGAPQPGEEDGRSNLDKAYDILWDVTDQRVQREKPTTGSLRGHVEVFCNLDRYKATNKLERVWHKTVKAFIWVTGAKAPDSALSALCNSAAWSPGGKFKIQAVSLPGKNADSPSELQICPEWLAEVKAATYRTSRHTTEPLTVPANSQLLQMNLMFMFDNVLLHELIHRPGGVNTGVEVYNWLGVGSMIPARAIQNAESVAYLALGIRMIKDQNLIPQEDGSVLKKETTSNVKPNIATNYTSKAQGAMGRAILVDSLESLST